MGSGGRCACVTGDICSGRVRRIRGVITRVRDNRLSISTVSIGIGGTLRLLHGYRSRLAGVRSRIGTVFARGKAGVS